MGPVRLSEMESYCCAAATFSGGGIFMLCCDRHGISRLMDWFVFVCEIPRIIRWFSGGSYDTSNYLVRCSMHSIAVVPGDPLQVARQVAGGSCRFPWSIAVLSTPYRGRTQSINDAKPRRSLASTVLKLNPSDPPPLEPPGPFGLLLLHSPQSTVHLESTQTQVQSLNRRFPSCR